jgi:hypothetical protein
MEQFRAHRSLCRGAGSTNPILNSLSGLLPFFTEKRYIPAMTFNGPHLDPVHSENSSSAPNQKTETVGDVNTVGKTETVGNDPKEREGGEFDFSFEDILEDE